MTSAQMKSIPIAVSQTKRKEIHRMCYQRKWITILIDLGAKADTSADGCNQRVDTVCM